MPSYRIGQVAELLGVSVDTVRRWADTGRLGVRRTEGGQRVVDGAAMADRLVVLEGGRVTQTGSPAEVSRRPRSPYVAELVGVNLYRGKAGAGAIELEGGGRLVATGDHRGEVFAAVHPHAVALHRRPPEGTPRNSWPGTADTLEAVGDRVRVHVTGIVPVVAEVTPAAATELALADGGPVWASVKATEVVVYPA
jgi:molybdate transport system ATP-binding protein